MKLLWLGAGLVAFLLAFLPVGCSPKDGGSPDGSKITVVASIFPLADLAQRVGGERVEVITLLSPGQSPHGFEPKPRQAETLASAKLLVTVGLGLDPWAERTAQASGNRTVHRIVLADLLSGAGVKTLSGEPGDEHSQGPDPHIWLDVHVMGSYVDVLAREYAALDPEHASEYTGRAERCRAGLVALDEQYRRDLAGVPGKSFVCFHAAYGYLAERYGLKQVSLMDVNVGQFGSRRIETVINFIRENHVKTIFAEPDMPDEQFRAIAAETGARVARLDDMGNPTVRGYDSYDALMRANLRALVEALKE